METPEYGIPAHAGFRMVNPSEPQKVCQSNLRCIRCKCALAHHQIEWQGKFPGDYICAACHLYAEKYGGVLEKPFHTPAQKEALKIPLNERSATATPSTARAVSPISHVFDAEAIGAYNYDEIEKAVGSLDIGLEETAEDYEGANELTGTNIVAILQQRVNTVINENMMLNKRVSAMEGKVQAIYAHFIKASERSRFDFPHENRIGDSEPFVDVDIAETASNISLVSSVSKYTFAKSEHRDPRQHQSAYMYAGQQVTVEQIRRMEMKPEVFKYEPMGHFIPFMSMAVSDVLILSIIDHMCTNVLTFAPGQLIVE
ncbi:hypothetical protein N7486_011332 [Penicillium sp. IBT 16267x]|nr:hypothetical protein N7486_011332 [Penicillium sp. IBT 16267x]